MVSGVPSPIVRNFLPVRLERAVTCLNRCPPTVSITTETPVFAWRYQATLAASFFFGRYQATLAASFFFGIVLSSARACRLGSPGLW